MYAALAFGAAWCVPPALRGEAGSWLFILVTSQVVTPIWFAPRALSVPLAVTPGVAFAAGTALAPATVLVTGNPRGASLVLTFERPPSAGWDVAGPEQALRAEAEWRAVLEAEGTGPGCLEVHWRTVVPV